MSPGAQSRNDTLRPADTPPAKRHHRPPLGEGGGVKGCNRFRRRAKRGSLRPSFSPSTLRWPCARPILSVATIPTWWLDRGQFVRDPDRRAPVGALPLSWSLAQRFRQSVQPRGAIGLDVDQFAHGVAPTLNAATAINGWRARTAADTAPVPDVSPATVPAARRCSARSRLRVCRPLGMIFLRYVTEDKGE